MGTTAYTIGGVLAGLAVGGLIGHMSKRHASAKEKGKATTLGAGAGGAVGGIAGYLLGAHAATASSYPQVTPAPTTQPTGGGGGGSAATGDVNQTTSNATGGSTGDTAATAGQAASQGAPDQGQTAANE